MNKKIVSLAALRRLILKEIRAGRDPRREIRRRGIDYYYPPEVFEVEIAEAEKEHEGRRKK